MIKKVLVTEDGKAYVTDNDTREALVEKAKQDTIINRNNYTFVDLCTPLNGNQFTPIKEWTSIFITDFDLPFSIQANKDKRDFFDKLAKKAVTKWARNRIFINQKNITITESNNWIKDCENVCVDYDAVVYSYGESSIKANGISHIIAYDKTKVCAYSATNVEAYDNSEIDAYHSVTVTAFHNSRVLAYNNVNVKAFNNVRLGCNDNSIATIHDLTTVCAHENSAIEIYGCNHAEGCGKSKLIIPSTSKATKDNVVIRSGSNAIIIKF